MKSYAQNREDLYILDYFKDFKGTLLSVGENDGTTYSNARLLIENGWAAILVEPASVFTELKKLYKKHPNVGCYNIAIGERNEKLILHESGNHVPNSTDKALVSSLNIDETERWVKNGVKFTQREVEVLDFPSFWKETGFSQFDFISIDAEGFDEIILKQINLEEVGCKALIIEWNGDNILKSCFVAYCAVFGLELKHINRENLIFFK